MWDEELVDALIRVVRRDMREERFSRDLWDKLRDRQVRRGDIEVAIGKRSYVGFYFYKEVHPRFGFYYPTLNLFVAWNPRAPSRIETVMRPRNRLGYLEKQDSLQIVWRPR